MEELISFLCAIAAKHGWPLSKECIAYLRKVIKKRALKKGELLLEGGQTCKNIYFIKTGLLKCYYLIREKEVVDWFMTVGETVVSIESFYDQIEGDEFMKALEDSELYYITYEELEFMYRTFVEFNVVGRALTIKYLKMWHQEVKDIRMLSSDERYRNFLEKQAHIVNRIDVQDVASHLDMTRETLSRARAKI